MAKTNLQFRKLIEVAHRDPNIIGFFLTGSRGKGMVTKHSDYDAYMVVRDAATAAYRRRYKSFGKSGVDLVVLSLTDFKKYAAWNGPQAWDRYNFAHLKVALDKTGTIQKLVDEKGALQSNKAKNLVRQSLDEYINAVYRSIKCFRDGNRLAAHLEATRSISPLIQAVFALNDRIAPYPKYLTWELKHYPLKKIPLQSKRLLHFVSVILKTGDIKTQQNLFKMTKSVFVRHGYASVFNSWEGKDDRMVRIKLK
jgi:transcriptional/translational regulatory protein YebC/TACO1